MADAMRSFFTAIWRTVLLRGLARCMMLLARWPPLRLRLLTLLPLPLSSRPLQRLANSVQRLAAARPCLRLGAWRQQGVARRGGKAAG